MESRIKRKRGRPKGEPTFTKSIRVDWRIRNFLDSIDNQSTFINEVIRATPEFKAFQNTKIANSKERALFN